MNSGIVVVTDCICLFICMYIFIHTFLFLQMGSGWRRADHQGLCGSIWLEGDVPASLSYLVWGGTQGISLLNATSAVQCGMANGIHFRLHPQSLLECRGEKGISVC